MIDLGLERMHAVLGLLGNPERFACPVVHITGTNGKGSVAEMVASGLAPKCVGIFTSPFLVEENDAIRIFQNGISACIPSTEMMDIQKRVCALLSSLTDFEVLVVTALIYFQQFPVDAVVIEVGMGGARDATNVFEKSISVLTSIGLDHQQFLGSTIEEICKEKCGIFAGKAVVNSDIECMHVIESMWANHSQCRNNQLVIVSQNSMHACPFNGAHQSRLMQMAIEVIRIIDPKEFDLDKVVQSIGKAVLPGRLEKRFDAPVGFPLLLDGVHNADSAKALRVFVDQAEPILWILATSKGRENIVPILIKPGDTCICIPFKADGAVAWVQTAEPETLAELAKAITPNVIVLSGLESALATATKDQQVVVAGSLYLVRDYLRYVSR